MNRVDRESFQKFLGNAFAAQESGLDPHTLAAFIDIQRFIGSDAFDVDGAIRMIAECALRVSNAAGVAIAQVVGDELVYRAGIGSAAENVGRSIPAVLAASSPDRLRREILRVENAAVDRRVESEICRQFGAVALIVLPIHHKFGVAGVLQVLFSEAHCFHEREVRAYQLLVGAIEVGIARLERTSEPPQERPTIVENVPQELLSADQAAGAVVPGGQPGVARLSSSIKTGMKSCRDLGSRVTGELSGLRSQITRTARMSVKRLSAADFGGSGKSAVRFWGTIRSRVMLAVSVFRDWLMRAARKDVSRLWLTSLRASEAVIIAGVVLMTGVWIVNRSHSPSRGARLTKSATTQSQILPAAKPLTVSEQTQAEQPQAQTDRREQKAREQKAVSKGAFRRVRVGPNETDYVADDVTIRHFATDTRKHAAGKNIREKDFGDDVTVRYFADAPEVASRPSTSISRPAAAIGQSR